MTTFKRVQIRLDYILIQGLPIISVILFLVAIVIPVVYFGVGMRAKAEGAPTSLTRIAALEVMLFVISMDNSTEDTGRDGIDREITVRLQVTDPVIHSEIEYHWNRHDRDVFLMSHFVTTDS